MRETKQKEIIREEIENIDSFFNAEDLYELIGKKDPGIGLATIYRFLKKSVKEKSLYSYVCDRRTVYSKKKRSHCHFVCEKTGKIIHFDVDSLDFLKNKIPGDITSFQIEVKGVCNECGK